jgi:subtilisin
MRSSQRPRRFILLPAIGLTSDQLLRPDFRNTGTFQTLSLRPAIASAGLRRKPPKAEFRVVQSMHENGPKLCEMTEEAALALRLELPGVQIVPEIFYSRAAMSPAEALRRRHRAPLRRASRAKPSATRASTVRVRFATPGGQALAGALITYGAAGFDEEKSMTNSAGEVRLRVGPQGRIDYLLADPAALCWPLVKEKFKIAAGETFHLNPIDVDSDHIVRKQYGEPVATAGTGVRLGIVDSGIAPHADLTVNAELSRNFTGVEDAARWGAASGHGGRHGTHVAGIVAGRRTGLAPGADLVSYRVFPDEEINDDASNFAVISAIDKGVADRCDLINLSLGYKQEDGLRRDGIDVATERAIEAAVAAGCVCVVAAGNEARDRVAFPARLPLAVAVSAMGSNGTYPTDSAHALAEGEPARGKSYFANFSNHGDDVDLIGPGVGVVSTVAGGYAAMDGTSMACPAVTGFMAARLGANAALLRGPRDASRAAEIKKLAYSAATPFGFGRNYEGFGAPRF